MKLNKWNLLVSMAILGAALVKGGPARAAELVIGQDNEMTGPIASVAVPLAKGVQLAVEEINKTHFLGADTIKLLQEDNGSDRTQSQALVNKLAISEKALAIIGPLATTNAMTAAPLANDLHVPFITGAYSGAVLKVGPYIFKVTEPSEANMQTLAKFTADTLKPKRCYVVFMRDNEGYVALKDTFEAYAKAHGIEIVGEGSGIVSDTDFSAQATKIVASGADCLQVDMVSGPTANLIIQTKTAGLPKDVKIITGAAEANSEFLRIGGKAVEGVYVASDYALGGINDEGHLFEKEYREKYHEVPDNWGAVGYGMMKVLATAIKNSEPEPTREKVRAALASTQNQPTILGHGKISFDTDKVPHYGVSVLVVKDGAFAPAD